MMSLKVYREDEYRIVEQPDTLLTQYHSITAAGGVVINDDRKVLLIFRRGKWDLPKGKAEPGETLENCAEREVKEETGLSAILLQRFLITTYHIYEENGRHILKDTHWFLFHAEGRQTVKPQTEEDITRIEWSDVVDLKHYTKHTYRLIKDVLIAAGFPV